MANSKLFTQYMEPLLNGQRETCRKLVLSALDSGVEPRKVYSDLIWPALEHVDKLYREDRINLAEEHMATRINRTVADHVQARLDRATKLGKKIIITCAEGEAEEISAQMCSDLFEADGWDVYFLGGGIPQDEVASLVGRLQPDMLMIVGSKPADAPILRQMIDYIRNIDACPTMNVLVSGGVFSRADGLWREVKADFFAETASEALEIAAQAQPRKAEKRALDAPKKRRRRRRPPLLVQSEGQV
ncbi:MAG: B12-binding domain-containing protein [Phycisphaerales bacterium]|nr:B12-binding domain-containing protein [Phycisphaerales bacterium]